MSKPGFWEDNVTAAQVSQEYESIKSQINEWEALKQEASDLIELSEDESLTAEIEKKYQKLEQQYSKLEFAVLFSSKYDNQSAILSIHAGTGGVDAQDWAEILFRMYSRFCDNHAFKIRIIDQTPGSEAGIKSVTLEIVGHLAYGWLKSENGVHRLVRISPFDAEKMRHTSFALVEVLPNLEETTEVDLKAEDLKIEVMRAGGHGGQSVNTTDSAVRITHIPTKISVRCQNERSQLQNKKTAFKILTGKLLNYYGELENKELKRIKGDYMQAEWGNQARSYIMQPYQLVKDHRTGYETSEIEQVLDGDLDQFIESYLRYKVKKKSKIA